jgi:E-phenylitaconyl-CoA hydratase
MRSHVVASVDPIPSPHAVQMRSGAVANDYEFVLYERRGPIAYLTMNRPEVLNALNRQHQAEIEAAKAEFAEDPEAMVMIMTGAGDRAFCAGADLKSPRESGGGERRGQDLDLRYTLPVWKPMIAAINGWAVGGGLAYAMQCDIRIASETARMGYSEARIGVPGGPSDNWLFPRYVPYGEAMYYLLTAEFMDAQEARRIGLVHEVLAPERLMARAEEIARRIAENNQPAVRAIKQAAFVGLSLSFDMSMRFNHEIGRGMRNDADSGEARRAFSEKRPAQYEQR